MFNINQPQSKNVQDYSQVNFNQEAFFNIQPENEPIQSQQRLQNESVQHEFNKNQNSIEPPKSNQAKKKAEEQSKSEYQQKQYLSKKPVAF